MIFLLNYVQITFNNIIFIFEVVLLKLKKKSAIFLLKNLRLVSKNRYQVDLIRIMNTEK